MGCFRISVACQPRQPILIGLDLTPSMLYLLRIAGERNFAVLEIPIKLLGLGAEILHHIT